MPRKKQYPIVKYAKLIGKNTKDFTLWDMLGFGKFILTGKYTESIGLAVLKKMGLAK